MIMDGKFNIVKTLIPHQYLLIYTFSAISSGNECVSVCVSAWVGG